MKGRLQKSNKGWVVLYTKCHPAIMVKEFNSSLPLHPDPIPQYLIGEVIDNGFAKVEFEIVKNYIDEHTNQIQSYAKLINDTIESRENFHTEDINQTASKDDKEKIICAAIWYKELPTQRLLPKNIDRGIVICGHRHGQCIDIMKTLGELRTVTFSPDGVGEHEQGFLTNTNKFVDRLEAAEIAVKSGQVYRSFLHNPRVGLFSEDLY